MNGKTKTVTPEEKFLRSLSFKHQKMIGEMIESVRSASIMSMSDDPKIDTAFWEVQSFRWLQKARKLQGRTINDKTLKRS